MGSSVSRAKPRTTRCPNFLDLPSEIRILIYDTVFRGSVIKLAEKARGRLKDKDQPPPLDLSTTPTKNAILGTCRAVRDEALPVLAKHTTLDIRDADCLRVVPQEFLGNIRIVTVDVDVFLRLKRASLSSLEHVTLVARVAGITGMPQALHFLHCPACGGSDVFLEEGLGDILDWKWAKTQIIYLSVLEGWTVNLKVSWECHSLEYSYLEVLYDLESNRVLHQKGIVEGTVFDASDWAEADLEVRKIAKRPQRSEQTRSEDWADLGEHLHPASGKRLAPAHQIPWERKQSS